MTKMPRGMRVLLSQREDHFGLPLQYLRALRSDIVRDWRLTKRPTARKIKKWARKVADLNTCIAAMEAELVEQKRSR